MIVTALVASNVEKFDYPYHLCIEQSMKLGPVVVNVDIGSEDDTLRLIKKYDVHIVETDWGTRQGIDGKGTNWLTPQKQVAVDIASKLGDFVLYLDLDEIIGDTTIIYLRDIEQKKFFNYHAVTFNFIHFYGDINHIATGKTWYEYAVRLKRSDIDVRFIGDGWSFGNIEPRFVFNTHGKIYHYGHARDREAWHKKNEHMASRYNRKYERLHVDFDKLDKFEGEHPFIVQENKHLFRGADNVQSK